MISTNQNSQPTFNGTMTVFDLLVQSRQLEYMLGNWSQSNLYRRLTRFYYPIRAGMSIVLNLRKYAVCLIIQIVSSWLTFVLSLAVNILWHGREKLYSFSGIWLCMCIQGVFYVDVFIQLYIELIKTNNFCR